MHIWTETPLAEIWRQLRYLRSPMNVQGILSGVTRTERDVTWPESEELRWRAYEIAACVRQADEYYSAAETVGLATEPLLQYYGAQALAKAAILASSDTVRLQDIRYHGLATRPSNDELRRYVDEPAGWTVESEFAVTKADGVFPTLFGVVEDHPLAEDIPIRFREVVGRIPDLMPLYFRHYGTKPPMIKLRHEPRPTKNGHLLIITNTGLPHADITSHVPALGSGFEETSDGSQTAFRTAAAQTDLPDTLALARHTIDGRFFLVTRHESGVCEPPSVIYVGLYILGNLVRYKPGFWMDVIEGRESGSAAIVEAFLGVAKRRFTNDVLEVIWGERFTYGSPAYLA